MESHEKYVSLFPEHWSRELQPIDMAKICHQEFEMEEPTSPERVRELLLFMRVPGVRKNILKEIREANHLQQLIADVYYSGIYSRPGYIGVECSRDGTRFQQWNRYRNKYLVPRLLEISHTNRLLSEIESYDGLGVAPSIGVDSHRLLENTLYFRKAVCFLYLGNVHHSSETRPFRERLDLPAGRRWAHFRDDNIVPVLGSKSAIQQNLRLGMSEVLNGLPLGSS